MISTGQGSAPTKPDQIINSCAKIKNVDEELNGKYMLFQ
jgi:hypothetical protein